MEAIPFRHEASNELREHATPDAFVLFRERMETLTKELTQLQTVLDNQEAFALDEMAGYLSQASRGTPSEYRRTPRMKI